VNNVYAEPDAPQDMETGNNIASAIRDLAEFLGASDVHYTGKVPEIWHTAFENT